MSSARCARPAPGLRILLADHNRRHIELAQNAQCRSNARDELVVVQDGDAALELLFPGGCDAPAFLPDVIVMAIDLPPGNAMEIYGRVRASIQLSAVPVTLVMPSVHQDDVGMHYRVADNTSVCSPVNLSEAIEALGGYWSVFACLPPIA